MRVKNCPVCNNILVPNPESKNYYCDNSEDNNHHVFKFFDTGYDYNYILIYNNYYCRSFLDSISIQKIGSIKEEFSKTTNKIEKFYTLTGSSNYMSKADLDPNKLKSYIENQIFQ